MIIDLEGHTALVTGGTRGIGKQIVYDLLECGCDVKQISRKEVDFSDIVATEDFFEEYFKENKFTICINNAGICINNLIYNTNITDVKNVLNVNIYAPFLITRLVTKFMKENNYGRIVNISSIKSVGSSLGRSAYATSKSALNGLTRSTAVDMAPYGILVNSVSPGFTKTELTESILTEKEEKDLTARIPLGRFATVEDISKVVVFYASPLNTFTTGQNIIVDGGYTINI